MPPADLVWELGIGPVKLDGGTVALNADRGAAVTIKSPNVPRANKTAMDVSTHPTRRQETAGQRRGAHF